LRRAKSFRGQAVLGLFGAKWARFGDQPKWGWNSYNINTALKIVELS